MVCIPNSICLGIIRYSCPDELVGVEAVGHILVPGENGGIQRCADNAVFEDVPVGGGNDQTVHFLLFNHTHPVGHLVHTLGGRISAENDLARLQVPIGRAILGLQHTRLDDVCHQSAGCDESATI